MRVLLLGGTGQVSEEIRALPPQKDIDIVAPAHGEVDLLEGLSAYGKRVVRKQRNENTSIKIDAHRSSSSLIALTSLPASFVADNRLIRRLASQSRSVPETAPAGSGIGFSSTTGWPCRVMTTPSPLRARSISSDNWFLALAMLWVLIPKI